MTELNNNQEWLQSQAHVLRHLRVYTSRQLQKPKTPNMPAQRGDAILVTVATLNADKAGISLHCGFVFNYWGKDDDKYPAESKWHPLAYHYQEAAMCLVREWG